LKGRTKLIRDLSTEYSNRRNGTRAFAAVTPMAAIGDLSKTGSFNGQDTSLSCLSIGDVARCFALIFEPPANLL
jgi:hypothetical protein